VVAKLILGKTKMPWYWEYEWAQEK